MNQNRRGFVLAFFSLLLVCSAFGEEPEEIKRLGSSTHDRFLLCATSVFSKPALMSSHPPHPFASVSCPQIRDDLEAELKAVGILTIDGGDYTVFVPAVLWKLPVTLPSIEWKSLSVETRIEQWRTIPGSRLLPPEELEEITSDVLAHARTPLVTVPRGKQHPGEAAMEVDLLIDVHPLKHGTESVVAIWGQEHGVRRLIYGEIHEGEYRMLWDSPLFDGFFMRMGYRDVDGDGTKEIISTSRPHRQEQLLVVNTHGDELTRHEDCTSIQGYEQASTMCPVVGTETEFEEQEDGTSDLLVYGALENGEETVTRLRLIEGRYRAVR